MVQEVRRIMLTADELLSALEGYRRIDPQFLPEGKITACTPVDNSLRVTVKSKVTQINTDVIMRGDEATKPLIRFCIENNIIIPKQGQKSLYIKDGFASLYIVYNLEVEMPDYNASVIVPYVPATAPDPVPSKLSALMPADILKATATA